MFTIIYIYNNIAVNVPVLLDHTIIPRKDSAKYSGMYRDSRLNWNYHVRQKILQIREQNAQIVLGNWKARPL